MYYYQSFIISSYSRNPETCQAFLNYSFDDQLHFQEVLDFRTDQTLANTHIPDIHTILTNIHIAL